MSSRKFYVVCIKPGFDFFASLMLLLILAPLMVLIGILVFIQMRRNPLFFQKRIGKSERPFFLVKFRTFRINQDHDSIGVFGRFLRGTSLDELPQLINILSGDMSFVGPRPLLPNYLNHYTTEEKKRHHVKPGLTGRAQLALGNSPDWDKRMKYDLEYLKEISFWYDFKLLTATVFKLVNFIQKSDLDHEIERFDEYAQRR